jgi:hypothetical protein
MFHSSWDVEVFARDMQERRMREAATARRIAAVELPRPSMRPRGLAAAISAIVAAVRKSLAPTGSIRCGIMGQPIRLPDRATSPCRRRSSPTI